MKSRIGKGTLLILLAVSMSSCPPPTIFLVSPGLCQFTLNRDGQLPLVSELTLESDGSTSTAGATWFQDGSTFVLDDDQTSRVFTGRVESPTSIVDGTETDNGVLLNDVTFVALRL